MKKHTPARMARRSIIPVCLLLGASACGPSGDTDDAATTPPPPQQEADATTAVPDAPEGTQATTQPPEQYEATVVNREGDEVGSLNIHPLEQGVRVVLHVEGLEPGPHAVHFHQRGSCEPPDFTSAGGHYNPTEGEHGMPDADEDMDDQDHHAGDMLNQTVNDIGMLDAELVNQTVSLNGPKNALLDADGTALVIHAGADDYTSQPSGDAGERVACAEITTTN